MAVIAGATAVAHCPSIVAKSAGPSASPPSAAGSGTSIGVFAKGSAGRSASGTACDAGAPSSEAAGGAGGASVPDGAEPGRSTASAAARRSSSGRHASRLRRAHSTRLTGNKVRRELGVPSTMPVTSATWSSAMALSSSSRIRCTGSGVGSASSPAATLAASCTARSHCIGPSVRIIRSRSPNMLRRKSAPPDDIGSVTPPMLRRPCRGRCAARRAQPVAASLACSSSTWPWRTTAIVTGVRGPNA